MPTSLLDTPDGATPRHRSGPPPVHPLGEPVTASLPPVVDASLAPWRARLAREARGRVLVVGRSLAVETGGAITEVATSSGPVRALGPVTDPLSIEHHGSPGVPAGRFDTVVSVGALTGEPDLPAAIDALCSRLAQGGRLLLVESTRSWRAAVALLSSTRSLWGIPPDVHLQRDLIGALWDRGVAPLVVERFAVPTPALPLRTWGYVVAARLDEIGAGEWA